MKISEMFKQIQLKDPKLVEPLTIKYTDENGMVRYLTLTKSASKFIYSKIGVSLSVSNKMFRLDTDLWNELIEPRIHDPELIESLSHYNYIVNGATVVDITQADISGLIEDLSNGCDSDKCKMFTNQCGVLQIKITDKVNEKYNSVVMLDIDYNNGYYCAYDGVEFDGRIVLTQSPFAESYRFSEFVSGISIKSEVEMASRLAENIYKVYNVDEAKKILMSARETLDVIKNIRCEVELDEEGFVSRIDGAEDLTDHALKTFINSFGLTYKSIKKLGYFRKSLRYNSLTLDDMLKLMSKEYDNIMNNCNAYVLSKLLNGYYRGESDISVLEDETNQN